MNKYEETLGQEIIAAKLINIETNEEFSLSRRTNSSCLFCGKLVHNGQNIQLRVDLDALDPNNDPILDAEILRETARPGRYTHDKKACPHHTKKEYDDQANAYLYDFEFEGLKLRLVLVMTKAVPLKGNASATIIGNVERGRFSK